MVTTGTYPSAENDLDPPETSPQLGFCPTAQAGTKCGELTFHLPLRQRILSLESPASP